MNPYDKALSDLAHKMIVEITRRLNKEDSMEKKVETKPTATTAPVKPKDKFHAIVKHRATHDLRVISGPLQVNLKDHLAELIDFDVLAVFRGSRLQVQERKHLKFS